MATRRPNMPRANRATGERQGTGTNAAPGTAPGLAPGAGGRGTRGSGGPAGARPSSAKVIPLGAVPSSEPDTGRPSAPARSSQDPASEPSLATSAARGTSRVAGASQPDQPRKASAARPARTAQRGPASSASPRDGAPARPTPPSARKPARKANAPRSERRLRERAELSGAIRAPRATSKGQEPRPAGREAKAQPAASPVPARSFSGRLLALAVVLVAITILLLPSVATYAGQRAEMAQLRETIAVQEAEQAELKEQIARWDDPVYIRQQARERINLVMPGERKYMVVGAPAEEELPENASPGDVRTDLPWVDALWDTVKRSATD
ncbi:septum formation initiator family protein [Zafaria sp. Z1313]|uniref:septum formation initiator family protein n=1 Tax=unclassified Zafaria TaxID=2828765 RepID=UPI002E799C79|nr:septum formation initiator family protein [Zafaria sp. J156]MEE1619908.1 septum formation initiator family protein [Zafaria sp. J156]